MRELLWAVLAIGEGDAEVAFLEHLKAIYVYRGCGATLKVKAALGKGARHVVEHTIQFSSGQEFDRRLVLFDTDTDYDSEVQAIADAARLISFPSSPCLEATLLRLHGDIRERTSDQHKRQFEQRFGGRVQDGAVLATHFDRAALEGWRDANTWLHGLINTFGVRR
jgi:hypothetical protein